MISYRYEYNGNSEYVTLHVTHKLTESDFVNKNVDGTLGDRELLAVMSRVVGASEVSIRPYEVALHRGAAFERDEVLDAAWETLKMWLSTQGIDCSDAIQKPTIRSDISVMQCPECQAEQDREMARSMRDLDSLGW